MIRVEEVVNGGVVLIDRLLDQSQTQKAGIELDILRSVSGDGGDMVDPLKLHSCLLRCSGRYDSGLAR
jgi:hypothetical protein